MKANLSVRASYIIEMPELWYLIDRTFLTFKIENDFAASLIRLQDLQIDGEWKDSNDTRLVFDYWTHAETGMLEVIEKLPSEADVISWRPNFAVKEVAPIQGFPNRYGPPWIPNAFWAQAEEWRKSIDRRAREVIGELCWRLGIHDGPSQLRSDVARLSLSPVQSHLRGLPMVTMVSPDDEFWNPRRVDSAHLKSILGFMTTGSRPPIHHELLQDAWKRRAVEPRVAVVMGVAAAETAVKALVAELLPQTQWILENLPAPPIVKIITHQIPLLPARNNISGAVCIPKRLKNQIAAHVELRNRIVHGRGGDVSFEEADAVLQDVRDVLCFVDYYVGHAWAIEFLSASSRSEAEKEAALLFKAGPSQKEES